MRVAGFSYRAPGQPIYRLTNLTHNFPISKVNVHMVILHTQYKQERCNYEQ